VARLPHDQRVAVVLHFHLDMPLSEVAQALGISQPGVKTRINRALKRLRPAMGAVKVKVDV
jgi:RNA polymerase sigma factor (sigma-70 family)